MKKIFALLLALVMVLSFAACGGSSDGKKDEPDEPSSAPSSVVDVDEPVGIETEEVDTETFTIGETSGKTYENAFFNIAFDLPDSSWSFSTDEEIAQVSGVTVDMLGDEYAELFENAQIVFAMMAKTSSGSNVNVSIEKLPEGYEGMTAEQYADLSAQNANNMLAQAGATNIDMNQIELSISGESMPACETNYDLSGVKVYQKMFVVCRDGYACCATATAIGSDKTDDILSSFYLMY